MVGVEFVVCVMKKCWLCLLCLLALTSCEVKQNPEIQIINDFEAEEALDGLFWKCRTVFTKSDHFVTHGSFGVMVEMYPDNYPGFGFSMADRPQSFSEQHRLMLDIFNPQPIDVSLHYRVDDRSSPAYGDRVNGTLILSQGRNRVELTVDDMITTDRKRQLDLNKIGKILFFLSSPKEKITLHLDYIRLEPIASKKAS